MIICEVATVTARSFCRRFEAFVVASNELGTSPKLLYATASRLIEKTLEAMPEISTRPAAAAQQRAVVVTGGALAEPVEGCTRSPRRAAAAEVPSHTNSFAAA